MSQVVLKFPSLCKSERNSLDWLPDCNQGGPRRELGILSNTLVKCCVSYELHGAFLVCV